jgi:hypothetical protein
MNDISRACLAADVFVWTRYGPDAGEDVEGILARKEAERKQGSFWWGVGNSINREKLAKALNDTGGTLHVLFSEQLKREETCRADDKMKLWTLYQDWQDGQWHEIPDHALVVSKDTSKPKRDQRYYALVCESLATITRLDNLYFHEESFQGYPDLGPPGRSQNNTALVKRKAQDHGRLRYKSGFCATLLSPHFVRLAGPRLLTSDEKGEVARFRTGDYSGLIQRVRFQGRQRR